MKFLFFLILIPIINLTFFFLEKPKRKIWNRKMKRYLKNECQQKGFENLEEWERSLLLKFYAIEWDEDEEGNKIYNFHEKNN